MIELIFSYFAARFFVIYPVHNKNALNGIIGSGVPQCWSTHMIGHELTALLGIDHGHTLAILQPSIWQVRKEQKRDKLLKYAERVWNIT